MLKRDAPRERRPMKWKTISFSLLAFILAFAIPHRLTLFSITENIFVLLATGALTTALLFVVVAASLFWEGTRIGFQWLITKCRRIAWHRLARPETLERPSLRRF